MNIADSNWDFPIYFNPTFDEIVKLAESKWDTCRILITENKELIIASGYGNTHSSMVNSLRVFKQKKRNEWTDCFILFHESGRAFFNLEDVSGKRKAEYSSWSEYFDQDHLDILKDLVRESSLTL